MQRIYNQTKDSERQTFITTYYEAIIREAMGVSISEIYQYGGHQCWKILQERCKQKSQMLSFMAGSMANMHYMNDNSSGKLSSLIAGNSNLIESRRISIMKGITLKHHGITHCIQLFGINELTGRIDITSDRAYPESLQNRHSSTVEKCKQLRHKIASKTTNATRTATSVCSITTAFENGKLSKLNRLLNRDTINNRLEGPPSYKTRKRDKYALPPLHTYMTGYLNIVKSDIPSKTKEISFNILNRMCWTNQKRYKSLAANNMGEEGIKNCSLCCQVETTQHLIFECQEYSEGLWEIMSKVISEITGKNIQIHIFNVMYNIKIREVENKIEQIVFTWIQEVKRYIVCKRYLRETKTSLRNIIYDKNRLVSHLNIVLNKIKSLSKYQMKNTTILDKMLEILELE